MVHTFAHTFVAVTANVNIAACVMIVARNAGKGLKHGHRQRPKF